MPDLLKILKYKSRSNDQDYFKETFLIYCLFVAACSFMIFMFVNYLLGQKCGAVVMFVGAFIESLFLYLFLKRIITFKQTVNFGISLGATCLFMDMYYSGGLFSSGLPWVLIFPVMSFFMLEQGGATRFWICVSCGIILFFGWIEPSSEIFVNGIAISKIDHILSNVCLVVIFSLIMYIFERKKREKIKEGEEQFRTMFEQAPMGITIFNSHNGGIIDINPKYSEIVGRSLSDMQKIGWEALTHPDDLQKDLELMDKLDKGEIKGFKLEKRYIRPDNSIVWVDMMITTFNIKKEHPFQTIYMCMIEDITERKTLEEQQKRANQMLKNNSRVLASQNEQLNDFCDIVSHNLRAPLASISMMTDYIEHCDDDDERMEMIGKIKPVFNNLNEIFNELVESLQVEQDIGIQSDQNDLQEIRDKITKRFELEMKLKEAVIHWDIAEASTIYFPSIYLDSIFTNLVSNALKYKSPDRAPEITIKTQKIDDTIRLSISDNGLGIDLEKHKNNLFKIRKVFHEHPDAKGFGLYITKKQIEVLGGKIEIESTPGIGTTFHLEFMNQRND